MFRDPFDGAMRDAAAFDGTVFLGLARGSRRDPYRLGLFAAHLESDEEPRILLPVQGGTLLVTDRRLLELRAHLDDHGAWNVKEFQGYVVVREFDRATVHDVAHDVRSNPAASVGHRIEDRIILTTAGGPQAILVSRGPEATLSEAHFNIARDAVLGPQAK